MLWEQSMSASYEQLVAELTGPGAPFEITVESVDGRPTKNWKKRERSLREKIVRAARFGDAECMVYGDRRLSYAEFARLVWGAARGLQRDHGFARGDRLAILAYNSPDWLIAAFGATAVGGIIVGLNGWWASEEIEYALTDSGSRFLVVDERLYPRVAELLARLPQVERVFYIGEHAPPGTIPLRGLLAPHDDIPEDPIAEDDPFVILYTSGTTGRPKGCITTHRGTIAQVLGILFSAVVGAKLREGRGARLSGPPTSLLTSPLFHVAGVHSVVCTALSTGAKLVFTTGKFDPEQVMQLIERERVSVWGAVPTMLHRVVHSPAVGKYDLSSLRTITFGGAPTAPETIEKAREVLPVAPTMSNLYGLTETHGVATTNGGKDLLGRMTSVGRPLPVLDVRVVGDDGDAVADGTLGQIAIFGPTVTPGYWNRPEATAEAIRDGWLYTGDLGYRDEEGFFFIVDRAKDMILRGGENVYCAEIENCLAAHPAIDEAAIIGVPDPELGERVKAVVRLATGATLDVDAVRQHVARHMAAFKVPEIVEFIRVPLPRNPAGKILKNLLRGTGVVAFDPDLLG
jgi:long-chain acyl-CoA synthetase